MARTSTARSPETLDAPGATIDHQALDDAGQALAQVAANVSAVEEEYGISMPYNLDLYIQSIRIKAAESAQRLIEIGQLLIIIREREPQGTFHAALDQIGLGVRFAQRAMQTAAKLRGLPRLQNLGVSKALELLSEDDDTLEALEHGGTLAGLTLDDVDSMSVRELKAALRAERKEREEEKATDEEIIRAKDERINKLTRDKRKASDEQKLRTAAEDMLRDSDEAVVEAASHIARLRKTFGDVEQLYADAGLSVDSDVAERLDANARWAADQLRELSELVGE